MNSWSEIQKQLQERGKQGGKRINIRPSKMREYQNKYRLEYRHRKGISKKYNLVLGISHTKEYDREYRIKNRDKIRLWRKKYKYNFKQAGKLSIKTLQLVYEDNIKKYGTLTCYLCLKPIEFGKDSLEHKQPLSRGGTNEYKNLEIACLKCNKTKHNKTVEEFKETTCIFV